MYNKFEFKSEELINLMRKSILFLAEKQLLIDGVKNHYDYYSRKNLNKILFKLEKNKIQISGLIWRAIVVKNRCFWFENGNIEHFNFENKIQLLDQISIAYDDLSKNKQKTYQKLLRTLNERITYKKIEHYLKFLSTEMNICISTAYGFDGYTIIIDKIYNYDTEGRESLFNKNKIKSNLNEIEKLKEKIKYLEEENLKLINENKNKNGLVL